MDRENRVAVDAVGAELDPIAAAVDAIADAFGKGGRLIYVGSGTSGRLGVLDAAECPPTFGVGSEQVIGLIAGGYASMVSAAEDEEDDDRAGAEDLLRLKVSPKDVVVGISASGDAAYVMGALNTAKAAGAVTVGLTCNKGCGINAIADIVISPDTGAEVITGSTRLKAGTAQKLVLNMLSTGAMIKSGKVYGNYMINVRPLNRKLKDRCIRIIMQITDVDSPKAEEALAAARGDIRKAIELIKTERK